METPPPLEYARPAAPRPLRWPLHLLIATFGFGAWAILVVVVGFLVPRFEMIFRDFKTDLPGLTKFLLVLSRWMANDYGWFYLLCIAILTSVAGILVDRNTNDRGIRRFTMLINLLATVLVMMFLALTVIALAMPIMNLTSSIK